MTTVQRVYLEGGGTGENMRVLESPEVGLQRGAVISCVQLWWSVVWRWMRQTDFVGRRPQL